LQRLQQEGFAILPLEVEQTLAVIFTNFSSRPWDRALTELVQDVAISRQIIFSKAGWRCRLVLIRCARMAMVLLVHRVPIAFAQKSHFSLKKWVLL
jgi:hypothetical protein